ncbi:MAG: 2-octaprenylphenol hydroxylase [Gammaproteobacteria bacterium]|nr:2-octaprenylphenol hydroxylase [Gammaproteobacteria bacterium]
MNDHNYDILVVGAGVTGGAFAASLKHVPLSVALLDAGTPPDALPTEHYDLRVSAVSPGTKSILQAVGAWERLDTARIGPYESMYVWDARSNGSIAFNAADMGEAWLGYIVENAHIQNALLESVQSADNINCRFGIAPERIKVDRGKCSVVLSNGETWSARLIVGADGAQSWVRQALGVGLDKRLYGQQAFVCEVKTERSHRQTAWQRFLPTGPVAFLPLANGHCSVVWTCDAELAAELVEIDEEAFALRLEAAFEKKLGRVDVVSSVKSFRLARQRATQYIGGRGALIGDAAHVVPPLAGQGANLGFADAWTLARVLREAKRKEHDIGCTRVLRRYERWRRSENFSMLRMLDVLHILFSIDSSVLGHVRGLGLELVDRQRWLKHFLARRALGRFFAIMKFHD